MVSMVLSAAVVSMVLSSCIMNVVNGVMCGPVVLAVRCSRWCYDVVVLSMVLVVLSVSFMAIVMSRLTPCHIHRPFCRCAVPSVTTIAVSTVVRSLRSSCSISLTNSGRSTRIGKTRNRRWHCGSLF